ncbi:MAG: pyrroline-5-carboxylate reductase [Acidobacteria bacterium]|nr:pyrroline-5-carboxylate reductase [Acidobacteriota bacterium]
MTGMLGELSVAVIGAGNLGAALLSGLSALGDAAPARLLAADADAAKIEAIVSRHPSVEGVSNLAAAEADVIVLAVKPHVVQPVLEEIAPTVGPEQLLISLAAAVPLVVLEEAFEEPQPIIRVMPNIAMTVHAAASGLCRNEEATAEHLELAREIFGAVGETVVVDEGQMHAVTGLSGSGPAYVFTLIEALAAGGVKKGLPQAASRLLAAQTFLGAAKLVLESGISPADLRDQVTTPGGTTIAGLHELERGGVRSALMDAVEAASDRSMELAEMLYGDDGHRH